MHWWVGVVLLVAGMTIGGAAVVLVMLFNIDKIIKEFWTRFFGL